MTIPLVKKYQLSVNLYQKKKIFSFKKQQNKYKQVKHYKNLDLYYNLNQKTSRPRNWVRTKFIKHYLDCLVADPMLRKCQNTFYISLLSFWSFYLKKHSYLLKRKKNNFNFKTQSNVNYNMLCWILIIKHYKSNSKSVFENRLKNILAKIENNNHSLKQNINVNFNNFYAYKKQVRNLSKLLLNKNIKKNDIINQKNQLIKLHQTYIQNQQKICKILTNSNFKFNYLSQHKVSFVPKHLRKLNFLKIRKINTLKGFIPIQKIKSNYKRNDKMWRRVSDWRRWHRWISHRYVAWKTKKPKLKFNIDSNLIKKTFRFFWKKWLIKQLNNLIQKKSIYFYDLRWAYFYNKQTSEWKSNFKLLMETDKSNFKLIWIKNDIKKNNKLYNIFLLMFTKSLIKSFISQFFFKSFRLFFKHSVSNFNFVTYKKRYLIWARKRFKVFYKRKHLIIKKKTLWKNKPWWERRKHFGTQPKSSKLSKAYHKNWTISQKNINWLQNNNKQNYLIDFFKLQKLNTNKSQIKFWHAIFCKDGSCFDWTLFSNYVAYHWRTKKGKKKRFKLIRNFRYETFAKEKMPIFKFIKFKRFKAKLNTFRKYWFYILGNLKKKNIKQIIAKSQKINNQRRRAQVVHYIKKYKLKRIINFDFIFEKRIDVILALFFNVTIYTARKFVKNNWVCINGRTINNFNVIYNIGDIIQLIPQNLYHNLYFTSWFLFFKKRNFHYNHFIYNLKIFCIMIINKNNSQLSNRFIFRQKWIRPKDRWQFKKWNYQKTLMTNSNLRLIFNSKL